MSGIPTTWMTTAVLVQDCIYWYVLSYTISKKYMTSYDGTGISRYLMVFDRQMTVYDEKSALLLVMDTVVLGTRPVPLLL